MEWQMSDRRQKLLITRQGCVAGLQYNDVV